MVLYSKNIVLENEVREGFIEIEGGRIRAILDSWDGPFADYGDQVILSLIHISPEACRNRS